MENTVFLVGAGPGDPGLLTVKGNNCLQIANVVVYDRLMDDSLLDLVPSDCERIFVGKSRGRQAFTQDEINQHVNSIEKAKLDLSDNVRTVELKNWLNYLKN